MSGGNYIYKYQACIPNSIRRNCEPLNIGHTLIDPCNPPNSISLPTLDTKTYTITDTLKQYEHPEAIVDPPYCKVSFEYDLPILNNGVTPVSYPVPDSRTAEYFYD